jgi:soluble lytic murein transglycosylase
MKKTFFYLFILTFILGVLGVRKVFPIKYSTEIKQVATKYDIDEATLYSIVKIESDFRATIISHRGARGLMQIMPATGQWIAETHLIEYSDEMLLLPKYNVNIGAIYISHLLNRYQGDMEKVLVAYNAGPSRLKDESWKNFKETKNYLVKFKIAHFFYKIRLFLKDNFIF